MNLVLSHVWEDGRVWLPEIIALICTSAIWSQYPVFPQGVPLEAPDMADDILPLQATLTYMRSGNDFELVSKCCHLSCLNDSLQYPDQRNKRMDAGPADGSYKQEKLMKMTWMQNTPVWGDSQMKKEEAPQLRKGQEPSHCIFKA